MNLLSKTVSIKRVGNMSRVGANCFNITRGDFTELSECLGKPIFDTTWA